MKKTEKVRRLPSWSWLNQAVKVGLAFAIAAVICQFPLEFLESFTYDLRVRTKPASPVSGRVATIAIDIPTTDALQRSPDAGDHTEFLRQLAKSRPQTVVYLLAPDEIQGDPQELQEFIEASRLFPNFYLAIDEVVVGEQNTDLSIPPPFDQLNLYPGPKTADVRTFAKDGVTRRIVVAYQNEMTLHPLLAMRENGLGHLDQFRGLFRFLESHQAYIDYHPSGTYQSLSFLTFLSSQKVLPELQDKIVFVGRDTRSMPKDYVRTPYSRDIVAMTALELHANMMDTMLLNSAPIRSPRWLDFALTSLISLLTVYVVLSLKPVPGLIILAATFSSFCVFAYFVFAVFGLWIGMAHPLLAIFICYYFFIPYRLIMENRRSWEYYQKHKLLTQVEELKSNFLRLMSHDLKTPIARIQGMTDVITGDTHPLAPQQQEAIQTIRRSSEELNMFIGSILDLGRIESKEIKLHLKSKDINTLLSEVIQKYEFLAKAKGIQIISEFEPLFSVKVDTDLMRQVFANLIENAIKYSPDNTRILVSTEEMGGQVIVQVADQGIGIPAEEIENVFSKFYRSHDVKNTDVKGTGLGLYLAKYFVELHKGHITVESAPQLGSTFTVELPMELQA